jgi:hypothetical protein
MTHRILALALFASALTVGCDGCQEPLAPLPDGSLPIGGEDAPRVLTYVGEDPLVVFRGDSATLRFTWKTETGLPVAGEVVTVALQGDAVSLIQTSFTTDTGGGVNVPVTAGLVDGSATVIGRATDLDGSVREDSVVIQVRQNPASALRVTVESTTRVPVVRADARILLGSNPPSCANLANGSPEPNAQLTASFAPVPSTQTFGELPTGTKAVVIVDGLNSAGVAIARGCADAGALPGGGTVNVTVTLGQHDTIIEGEYDILMHMALGDALPAPYDTTVELVTALLADPAGYAAYVVLREIDRQTELTTFVTRNGVEKTFRQIERETLENPNAYPTWYVARDRLDQLLEQQLGQTYVDVTNVGAGIRDVVTDFEVGARFEIDELTAGNLLIAESWREMVLYWPLPCESGDLSCARRPLSLADANLAPVITNYGGSYVHAPADGHIERFEVSTDPHGLNVRYGAFLLAILNQVVFPSLPESIRGDSFGDVLSNVVGCANIAAAVSSDPIAAFFVSTLCETALDYAANEVESRLVALQVGATNPQLGEEGLAAGGSFVLYDNDADLTTELVDDYDFAIAWYRPNNPVATQDISAPIFGDGLRARPVCTDDRSCSAGFTCQPRGSYLKIARAELGCGRARGALAGGAACVGDSQCASGLCAPVGQAGALQCYAACDALNDCSLGQICSSVGGYLDLDGVLNGLGDVAVPGCAAP